MLNDEMQRVGFPDGTLHAQLSAGLRSLASRAKRKIDPVEGRASCKMYLFSGPVKTLTVQLFASHRARAQNFEAHCDW